MTYCIYHIPGKKIGVTNNLEERVTRQQGYTEDEYEILDMSDDICYISHREIELQKEYGYKVDRKLYKDLNPIKQELNSMKINVTEQTTTFPCPVSELKDRLMDEMGMSWETDHGICCINTKSIKWIMDNVKTSMYNNDRCYVYNKAFARFFDNNGFGHVTCFDDMVRNKTNTGALHMSGRRRPDRFDLIRTWADERGLYDKGDTKTQFCKLMEEAGELGRAVLKDDNAEFVDAIGDMVVVLTNLAHLGGTTIEECIDAAYNEIKNRKGKMSNGTFVKNE